MFRAVCSRTSRIATQWRRPLMAARPPVTCRFPQEQYERRYHKKVISENFLSGTSTDVVEGMYQQWKEDPQSIDSTWNDFFQSVEAGKAPGDAFKLPARTSKYAGEGAGLGSSGEFDVAESFKVFLMVRAYRVLGHFLAILDPLRLDLTSFNKIKAEYMRELDPATYGFTEADMDRQFFVGTLPGGPAVRTLREIIDHLRSVYCGFIGVQYMHVHDPDVKDWVQQKIENPEYLNVSKEDKRRIFEQVMEAEHFESYCGVKFKAKRFGLDGGESLIPGMHALVESACESGVENIVIGMPHRGRLNVMANIMGKPLEQLFSEFQIDTPQGKELSESVQGSGDVKYHLGTSNDRKIGDKTIHLSLAANPSHLEAVNPVVLGKTRAKQTAKDGSVNFNKAMGVLIHGDAAFAGQGVVGEIIELSGLEDFSTGGTIHIIVNNQIGFTTVPRYARTSPYPSEIAKAAGTPIFHVNGDHPEAVAAVFKLAVEFRQKFNRDTVIDIYCYRRHGHNELDEPSFTQPKMYQKIRKHPTVCKTFGDRLVKDGVISEEERKEVKNQAKARLDKGFDRRNDYTSINSDWLECHWKGFVSTESEGKIFSTGVDRDSLRRVMQKLVTLPEGFNLHPTLEKFRFNSFRKMIETEQNFNWAMGEALAFGTLLLENYEVRLSGQDCERGTFNHRHAVLYDQETEETYESLRHVAEPGQQGFFNVINSSLSENAVLGFEHGYSLEHPNALVIWEAQFGDFVNGAQVIIDQFISSGEQKWLRMSGLAMFLPHGFEGQGPEHSSGRVERFLQLCDDDPTHFQTNVDKAAHNINLQVANCTTPANMFHLIRRQLYRNYRKPLIVMTPKSLLSDPRCVSNMDEFDTDSQFHRLYADKSENMVADSKVRKVVLCTGKVYYDLIKERERLREESSEGQDDVAILRVEQIAPFPYDLVKEECSKYDNAKILWVQEEPMNQGAWTYVSPRIETAVGRPKYVGRNASAAPATGLKQRHEKELRQFLDETFA